MCSRAAQPLSQLRNPFLAAGTRGLLQFAASRPPPKPPYMRCSPVKPPKPHEMTLVAGDIERITTDAFGELVLIQQRDRSAKEATWEDLSTIQRQFSPFNLGDKVVP